MQVNYTKTKQIEILFSIIFSRYVLVTLPEVPLRYNTPSYVERLLLPERFPTLFHNIIQSYDHHFTSHQHHRNTK
jgi:hypothetical protein